MSTFGKHPTWEDDIPTCADRITADAHSLAADLKRDFGTDYVRALRHLFSVWRVLPDPYEEAVQRETSAILSAEMPRPMREAWLIEWRDRYAVEGLVRSLAMRHIMNQRAA